MTTHDDQGSTAHSPAILTVAGLSAHINGQQVVEQVDLEVPATGVTALLGRNGVGKTSTIKAIMGLIERSGTVTLAGQETEGLPTYKVARLGVGYVPEDREVFAGLTVAENLKIAERAGGGHHYDLVYDLFPELYERADQAAGTLSGGQQQMVALARALLNDNKVLLVDEPTKGLAPRLVSDVTAALAKAAELVPVLLVEQNLTVVRDVAQGAVVLSGGRTVHTGGALALLRDPETTQRYLGVSTGGAANPKEADA
ncbi:ABC transporter ATP-binding protein [Ornithinimicrobium sp. Arc0846-15]|nr:ABC transporter ATP-binding protein [Ornithinimicrobium laminariae]